MRQIIFILLLLFLVSCSARELETNSYTPLTIDDLLKKPMDIPLKMEAFDSAYKKFKPKVFIRTLSSTQRKDTIYRYYRKSTSFIFYRTVDEKTFFLTARIRDDLIALRNNIRIGQNEELLSRKIIEFPEVVNDTVRLRNEKRQLIFVFDQSELKEITINNYYKKE